MTPLPGTQQKSQLRLAFPWIALLIGIGAGSFAPPFIKLSQQGGLPSPLIAAGRMGLAAIILTPFVLRYHRAELNQLSWRDRLMAMLAGLCLAIHFLFLVIALESTSVLIAIVIMNTAPLWVALLERFFLKERLNRYVWTGLLITISGSVFIAINSSTAPGTAQSSPLYGAILALGAAISGAGYVTVGRSIRRKISLFPYVWIVFGLGGIIGLIFALLSGIPVMGHPAEGYFWVLMLTLIPQLIGHTGINYALAYLSATLTSLSTQMVTITASVAAFFLFAEVPTMTDIIGSAIIASGVLIAIVYRSKAKSPRKVES